MRKTAIFFFSVLILLCVISCSSEGVVDDAFTAAITFNGNGATSGSMEAQKVGRGTDTRLEANAFERTFYRFTGWNTACDGSGTAYTDEQSINAKENITLYAQWKIDAIILTSDSTEWTDGNHYSIESNVTISQSVTVTGDVTLILPDGYTLTASKGIDVSEGNSLTIEGEGSGTLVSIGEAGRAGIGGGELGDSGSITINGGTVNAKGGTDCGAGIGGGYDGDGGEITINDGTIYATGGTTGGAGIGGGELGDSGSITINGGTVIATGGGYGAGIGGGLKGNGGEITINDGTVTATGDGAGAGIGGGIYGNGGSITINGGIVAATGGLFSEFGIGRGCDGSSDGNLTLGEGVVMKVSNDNSTWDDYDGTNRKRYMKTVQ